MVIFRTNRLGGKLIARRLQHLPMRITNCMSGTFLSIQLQGSTTGKYLGVVEPHTRVPTVCLQGFHLKELGITHLHLLPVFDYLSG